MAVLPEHRRQGLGRRLLVAAERQSSSKGARHVYLHVDTTNTAALGLYSESLLLSKVCCSLCSALLITIHIPVCLPLVQLVLLHFPHAYSTDLVYLHVHLIFKSTRKYQLQDSLGASMPVMIFHLHACEKVEKKKNTTRLKAAFVFRHDISVWDGMLTSKVAAGHGQLCVITVMRLHPRHMFWLIRHFGVLNKERL